VLRLADKRVCPDQVDAFALEQSVRSRRGYAGAKRLVDIASVLLASPAALLTLACSSILIAILMGRPILFVQNRVGQNGRLFKMVKLRTMELHGAQESIATARNDHRITPVGKFLRRSHLDELPHSGMSSGEK
jgi:lipopolysaccharide/colanic/teichoic acid biosynthesis glycosyltransferase